MVIDKDNIRLILIILVVSLGIGYAYINSDLNINGTAQVNSANWDVHWANIQVTNGSVSGTNVTTEPTISNGTTVNYAITLPSPGSFYEFTVDAVNGGSMDAMIDSLSFKINGNEASDLPAYLFCEANYADGAPLEYNQELKANTTETYKVRIEYLNDIDENQLPTTDQALNLSFTITYRQATEAAIKVNHRITGTVYAVNFNDFGYFGPGDEIPANLTVYSSAEEALAALRLATGDDGINFYLKHTLSEGIIEESYLVFIVTPEMVSANPEMTAGTYELRGGVYEEGLVSKPVSEANAQKLLTAFGSSNCTDNSTYIYCNVSGLYAIADSRGDVRAYGDSWHCRVNRGGASHCGNYAE